MIKFIEIVSKHFGFVEEFVKRMQPPHKNQDCFVLCQVLTPHPPNALTDTLESSY